MTHYLTSPIKMVFNMDNISHSLVPSTVEGVKQLKDIIQVDASQWEPCLKRIEEECAVKWTIFSKNRKEQVSNKHPDIKTEMASSTSMKKSRAKRVVFSQLYCCHRSGIYLSRAKSDGRPIQRITKKCGCTAQLKVVCYTKNPAVYIFAPLSPHVNHVPGDKEDVLSDQPKNAVTGIHVFQPDLLDTEEEIPLSTEEKERRRIQLEAESITEAVRKTMVSHRTGRYTVNSFKNDGVYDICVEKEMIGGCRCYYFQKNQTACKHMYLLHLHSGLPIDTTITPPTQQIPHECYIIQKTLSELNNTMKDMDTIRDHISQDESDRLLQAVLKVYNLYNELENKYHDRK